MPRRRAAQTALAGLAEVQRELIRARTGEGRKMGRPHKLTTHQQREARESRHRGKSFSGIAWSYNVHHTTIGRSALGHEA